MKTSISSDVWEKKKAIIAKLYMEEEWPLKQVIKQIRSDDFNPSETQLRSRLKKWRVTKPSRQTRKKTQGSEDPESEKESRTSSSSPRTSRASPAARKTPSASASASAYRSDWTHSVYGPVELSHPNRWNSHMGPQMTTPSPSSADHHGVVMEPHTTKYNLPDPNAPVNSYEQTSTHTSPAAEHVILNTTAAVTPSYAAYSLSPESCGPSPDASSNSAISQWPARTVSGDMSYQSNIHPTQWYNLPLEPMAPSSVVPHSAAPLTTPAASTGYAMYPGQSVYAPGYMHYDHSDYHHGYDAKQWKQVPQRSHEYASYANRSTVDRKHGYPHGGSSSEILPISASQTGPQTIMCAPMGPYSS
ncbi:hypothetical protein N7539_006909 [Penicillium diatomitis]|uniref:Clr5 domain-containing protein n=1 Tax=Penicillium diatomitis TaxID=2819901 RepID=A0A9W9X2G0_9EURO|nr:uncharacterized protein N7539_006909 [Penicillium diatomitis]KAJ5481015.1 hypothetical protein N7539_006909 [Penicillium diatomitis]